MPLLGQFLGMYSAKDDAQQVMCTKMGWNLQTQKNKSK